MKRVADDEDDIDELFDHADLQARVGGGAKKKKTTMIEPTVKKASMRPCGLITRQKELEKLGLAEERATCFGCIYVGEQDAGAVAYEDIMALLNMIRRSIARTDPVNLAIHLAQRYLQIQTDVNDNLRPGETPLPDWTAATILEHLRSHNTDPELQLWMRISEFQELAQIALNASVVVDPDTGTHSIDEKQCKMYVELCKTLETLRKSDPSKHVFYSGGNHIDMKTASQGPIATQGKTLITYLKS